MKQGSFFQSCVQIIVGVIVNEIQTAAGALVLQEQIQSQWRGLISNMLKYLLAKCMIRSNIIDREVSIVIMIILIVIFD